MDTVTCSCAMSNHASCACAGMLLLAHGTHMHLSCVCACLAGVPRTPSHLVHAVRRWRKTRLCGNCASAVGSSRACLPRLWLAAVDQLHSSERLWDTAPGMHAVTGSRLCCIPHVPISPPCIKGVRGPFPHKVGCLFPITVIALKMCVFGCLWDVLAGRICHAIAGRVTN